LGFQIELCCSYLGFFGLETFWASFVKIGQFFTNLPVTLVIANLAQRDRGIANNKKIQVSQFRPSLIFSGKAMSLTLGLHTVWLTPYYQIIDYVVIGFSSNVEPTSLLCVINLSI
jgi:hypothetical protein